MGFKSSSYAVLLTALLFAAASTARAAGPVQLMLNGGMSATFGTLGEQSNLGYNASAGIGVGTSPVVSSQVQLALRIGYAAFPSIDAAQRDISFVSAGLNLKVSQAISRRPNVYVIGGGGYARTRVEDAYDSEGRLLSAGFRETNPYLSLGMGLESGWFVIEAQLTNVFGTRIKNYVWMPVTLGIKL
jgi:hypothetical protein